MDKDSLVSHIDKKHHEQIPDGWEAARYENYLRTGKTEGHCVVCKKPTEWNPATGKYHRLCNRPECKEELLRIAEKNCINKYGVAHVLSDPEINKIQQRKMVYARKTSGTYKFTDPNGQEYDTMYDSSYGKDFLMMLDNFLQFSGRDVIAPSPHTYEYEYEGKTHYYIPDVYIISLNLEVELKDGGNNPNMHPKIQKVDKVKEHLKDETMYRLRREVNYIKIQNKDYSEFFALLSSLKQNDISYLPKWDNLALNETFVTEDLSMLINDLPDSITSHAPKWAKKYAYIQEPIVSYDKLIDILKNDIDKARTPKDFTQLEDELQKISEYLGKVANDTGDDNTMSDAAKRTKKKIDKELYLKLAAKKRTWKAISMESVIPITTMESASSETNDIRIPIFIVLSFTGSTPAQLIRKFTKEPYSHASIALNYNLNPMYSFVMEQIPEVGFKSGFAEEYIDKGVWKKDICEYTMWMFLCRPAQYETIQHLIMSIKDHREQYRYNMKGLIHFLTKHFKKNDDHFFCSEFVSWLLQTIEPEKWGRNISSYTPYGLINRNAMIHITRGKMKNYNPDKVKSIVDTKLKEAGFKWRQKT